jgi:hypothetical protein
MTGRDAAARGWITLPPTELVASVAVAPPPDIPVAAMRGLLVAVHDPAGRLVDWRLSPDAVVDPVACDPTAIAAFHAWRNTWVRRRPIGPVTNVRSLLDEAREIDHGDDRPLDQHAAAEGDRCTGGDETELVALLRSITAIGDRDRIEIGAGDAPRLVDQLDLVRLALGVDDRHGVGIVDDMPMSTRSVGLARSWAPPVDDLVVAADVVTSLTLRPGRGLVLRTRRHDDEVELDGVVAVDLRGDFALVLNDQGRSIRLSPAEARPLAWLVPRSLRWHLRPVPLVVVWSTLFTGLGEALALSTATGAPITIGADDTVTPRGVDGAR